MDKTVDHKQVGHKNVGHKKVGRQGVLLTDQEELCYALTQALKRRALWRRLRGIQRIVWPAYLDSMPWSKSWWRLILQIVFLIIVWPLIIVSGLGLYLLQLLRFPYLYIQTLKVPLGLKTPGEKTLTGMHNAFSVTLELSERDYIECIDGWVTLLFGAAVSEKKNLSLYLTKLSSQRIEMDTNTDVGRGVRSNLSVARELLSRDLGHYLATTTSCGSVSGGSAPGGRPTSGATGQSVPTKSPPTKSPPTTSPPTTSARTRQSAPASQGT